MEDGEEATARLALAEAAKGCVDMFQKLRIAWQAVTGGPIQPSIAVRRNRPKVAQPKIG